MNSVYRLYDEDDTIVYVGMTNNVDRRVKAHRRDKSFAYVKSDELPSRALAEVAEALLIGMFTPRYNLSPGYDDGAAMVAGLIQNAVCKFQTDDAFKRTWSEYMSER